MIVRGRLELDRRHFGEGEGRNSKTMSKRDGEVAGRKNELTALLLDVQQTRG